MFDLVFENKLLAKADVYHGKSNGMFTKFCSDLQYSDGGYDADRQA